VNLEFVYRNSFWRHIAGMVWGCMSLLYAYKTVSKRCKG